jgi:hypothetical protein
MNSAEIVPEPSRFGIPRRSPAPVIVRIHADELVPARSNVSCPALSESATALAGSMLLALGMPWAAGPRP